MANHFKRAKVGDIVHSRVPLPYLGEDIPARTRGKIAGVDIPGKLFRVWFEGRRYRLAQDTDLSMTCRRA